MGLAIGADTEHICSMSLLTPRLIPPFSPADREAIRRRLMVDRPLHWDLARALFAALEVAWDELARTRGISSGSVLEGQATEDRAIGREQLGDERAFDRVEEGLGRLGRPAERRP